MEKGEWPLEIPEDQFDVAIKTVAGLYEVKRTGWVNRNVQDPETVGQHIEGLIELAKKVAKKIPEVDLKKLCRMLQVHDWAEVIVGDIVTVIGTPEERKKIKEEKNIKEDKAMVEICAKLGVEGPVILNLWREFEAGETLEASFAKQLDKLQCILKAKEYQDRGEKVDVNEFIRNDAWIITHPVLVKILNRVKKASKYEV